MVESSSGLPPSVIAGLNRDTIFSKETIFCAPLCAGCEGCCNLAARPRKNTMAQLGHHQTAVHSNAKEIIRGLGGLLKSQREDEVPGMNAEVKAR